MRKIIYIINPVSGTRKKNDLQQFIEKKTREQNISHRVFPSVASGDYSFLHPLIREQKITDVVIAGGDGTVNQVISSLMDYDVNFGIIPCGSGNGLAFAARIPKQVNKALKIIFSGHAVGTDGFYLTDPDPSGWGSQFACMLCGLGFDARVAHDFADQQRRGLATYARLAIKNFLSMKKHRFQIQLQDVTFETEAYFISIANSNQFGNNFTIAPKASLSDGLLDIILATSNNKISFVWQTLQQLAGWNKLYAASMIKEKKGIIYFQTDQLNISNLTNAPLHIDGEPAEPVRELQIKIKKNCFRLLQPN
ncbi:MAG: diacylglycerol/lipid kinase family protein [Chitinophagaceae bacterium]